MTTPPPPTTFGLSPEPGSPVLAGSFLPTLAGGVNTGFGLLDTSGFPKRWHGGQWPPDLGWLHIASDLTIFAAFLAVPLVIVYFLIRRRDFPYPRLFVVFGAFVLFCGLGHAFEAISFWYPAYRLTGFVKVLTAIISWVAVVLAIRIVPKALKLADVNRMNQRLQAEMWERMRVEDELRRNEAEARKLAMIAARTDNAVILTDPQGRIEWINDGFTRITGYSPDEVMGRTPGSLLQGPETDKNEAARMRGHILRGEGFKSDILNYSKAGAAYWLHIDAQPIFDDNGTLIHFMAIESDVTERKKSEAALIALNGQLEARVSERTRELAMTNESLRHEVAVRRRTESALIQRSRVATLAAEVGASMTGGATPTESLRGCVEALVEHLDVAFARVWTLDEGSDTLRLRASAGMYTHLDGPHARIPVGRFKVGQIAAERRPFLINDVPRDPRIGDQDWAAREGMTAFMGFPLIVDDRVVGVMALFSRRSISEVLFAQLHPIANAIAVGIVRKRTEEDLRRSEERFFLATRATNEVIWDWDIASASVSWSDGVLGLIACGPEAVGGGRDWWEAHVHPDDRDPMRDGLRAALEGDVQVWSTEYRACRPDGSSVHVLDRGYILRDDKGEAVRVIGAMLDLTERMRAELEIRDLTERMRAESEIRDLNARLEQRLNRLDALRRIDVAITASLDLNLTLGIVLDQVQAQLRVDSAAILLGNSHDQALTLAASKGFRTGEIVASQLRAGEGCAGLAVAERRPIAISDLSRSDVRIVREDLLSSEGFAAYHAVPLVARGQVQGVLEVFHRQPFEADRDWLSFLEALAGQAAIAVDNANLLRDSQRSHSNLVAAYDATIEGWARAIDLRDKETEGHTRRVTEMTIKLGRSMGLTLDELTHMRRGALLHDIGKLGIPDSILLKPGKLTEEEWRIMRLHPGYAYEWLAPISFLKPAMDIPHCHHEKWDGTGYPQGLKGERIPLAARIFAAVDIWDALRSDRPYREGWPELRVLEYLRSIAGTHLDPAVVDHFLETLAHPETRPDLVLTGGPGREGRFGELQRQLEAAGGLIRSLEREGEELRRANVRLADLSETDELTGLKNRRHIRDFFEAAFSTASTEQRPLSVVMLDVDHFKSFNDEHGHRAGDDLLRTLATILRDHVRPQDLVARYGGEEFMILLPDTDAETGLAVAQRLRAAVAGHPWPIRDVTASFGVATSGLDVADAFELIESADIALYQSKASGRDRVTHRQLTPSDSFLRLAEVPTLEPLDSVA